MKRIDFIIKMVEIKNYNYNVSRQLIYRMDDKDLSIEEVYDEETGDVYVRVNDFDENKVLADITRNKNESTIKSVTVCDEWLLQELQINE